MKQSKKYPGTVTLYKHKQRVIFYFLLYWKHSSILVVTTLKIRFYGVDIRSSILTPYESMLVDLVKVVT